MDSDPFSLLLTLEQDVRDNALSFPLTKKPEAFYTGIGFGIGSHLLVVSLESVCEVILYPRLTPIPGIKRWVHGITAVRGKLLPVVELSEALGGPGCSHGRKARVLAVKYFGSMIGLLVDEVFGAKRFLAGERLDSRLEEEWLLPFLDGAFVEQEKAWNIFSVNALEKNGLLSRV